MCQRREGILEARFAGGFPLDGREGLRSLELLIAIYQSARDGRQVGLPLEY